MEFDALLGFEHSPGDEICVEETDEGDRYDVLIRRSGESHIIEGKIGPAQKLDQLLRYIQSLRHKRGRRPALTVVDDGSEFRHSRQRAFEAVERSVKALKFVTWTDVAKVCCDIARKRRNQIADPTGVTIAQELAIHLKENGMTAEAQPEIYLRDVSSFDSVQLYFRHHLYKCQSNFYNSARRNLYFAPYFTRHMADKISEGNLVPVGEGISFVSRVKSVQVIDTRDVLEFLKDLQHPNAVEAAKIVRKNHDGKEVLMMMLGEPRLMFISPVTKAKLTAKSFPFGQGTMGSRSCTFDDLLAASQ